MSNHPEVVLVHGLWYGSWAMLSLARRLRRAGHVTRYFRYRATGATVASNAGELAEFAGRSAASEVHYVGHSMGGLVILQMLCNEPAMRQGRVVLLGTPLQGSAVARQLMQYTGARALLGQAAESLSHGICSGIEGCEIGMIAGTRAFGLGRLLGQTANASDGTVALAEADAPYLSARIALPVSHTGLLYSAEVAREVCNFLDSGCFSRAAT